MSKTFKITVREVVEHEVHLTLEDDVLADVLSTRRQFKEDRWALLDYLLDNGAAANPWIEESMSQGTALEVTDRDIDAIEEVQS